MLSITLVGPDGDRMVLRQRGDFETLVWHLPKGAGMRHAVILKPRYVVLSAAIADGWTVDTTPDPAAAREAQRRLDAAFKVVTYLPEEPPAQRRRPDPKPSGFTVANLPKPSR